jgi:hypothetical protein
MCVTRGGQGLIRSDAVDPSTTFRRQATRVGRADQQLIGKSRISLDGLHETDPSCAWLPRPVTAIGSALGTGPGGAVRRSWPARRCGEDSAKPGDHHERRTTPAGQVRTTLPVDHERPIARRGTAGSALRTSDRSVKPLAQPCSSCRPARADRQPSPTTPDSPTQPDMPSLTLVYGRSPSVQRRAPRSSGDPIHSPSTCIISDLIVRSLTAVDLPGCE